MLTSELELSPARFWPSAEVTRESGISVKMFNFFFSIAVQSSDQAHAPLPAPLKHRYLNCAHSICTPGRQFAGHLYTENSYI